MPEPDYDHLLRSNLERVFNERDPARRAAAMAELFVFDPVMFEPDKPVQGRNAIVEIAGALLERFGPDFAFTPQGTAVGHHGMGVLHWTAGPAGKPRSSPAWTRPRSSTAGSLGSGSCFIRPARHLVVHQTLIP